MVWFWGLLITFEGSDHVDGFVGSDGVVEDPVVDDFAFEVQDIVDVDAVELFVFDRPEEPFDDPVGPWRLVPGPDVDEVAF